MRLGRRGGDALHPAATTRAWGEHSSTSIARRRTGPAGKQRFASPSTISFQVFRLGALSSLLQQLGACRGRRWPRSGRRDRLIAGAAGDIHTFIPALRLMRLTILPHPCVQACDLPKSPAITGTQILFQLEQPSGNAAMMSPANKSCD